MSHIPQSRANLERTYAPLSVESTAKPNSTKPTKPTTLVIRNEGYKRQRPKPAPPRLSARQRMEHAAEVAAQAFIDAGGMSL